MKNVLLTGPARGLGLAITQRLIKEGYHVIGVGRKKTPAYEQLMQEKRNAGTASFFTYDLEDLGNISTLIKEITEKHGPLYGLINNAALGADGVLATMHASDIAKILRINLEAPMLITKFACRSMLIQREGRIINISSIIASTGFNGLSAYGASKAGLQGFTRSLSRELGKAGITVNCVAPGFMQTDMTSSLEGDKLNSIRRRTSVGLPLVEDVAGAIAYLLSSDGQRITGTTITVDGGSTA